MTKVDIETRRRSQRPYRLRITLDENSIYYGPWRTKKFDVIRDWRKLGATKVKLNVETMT